MSLFQLKRGRGRGGTISIFGAKVLKGKVIPVHSHINILWFLLSSLVLEMGSVDPKVLALLK